jgi:K(+)-stimulated pyrophosphate-energized sodium pump
MELSNLLPPAFGVFGLAAAAYTYAQVKKYPEGDGKVVEIGNQIHLGAMVFMKREYKMLAMFSAVLLVLLYIFLGAGTAICFLMGAMASAGAGYIGMQRRTRCCPDGGFLRWFYHGPCGRITRTSRPRPGLPDVF